MRESSGTMNGGNNENAGMPQESRRKNIGEPQEYRWRTAGNRWIGAPGFAGRNDNRLSLYLTYTYYLRVRACV
ncbi:MAG: hypothetical protein K2N13_08150 [Paraprevotella sp.]|nr:hypothetical protein [Paraprevotella sp.]